jgi:hypothetical protein
MGMNVSSFGSWDKTSTTMNTFVFRRGRLDRRR